MQDQPTTVVWILLGALTLGLLALAVLRWVPTGHVLVVTRRGRVERVVPAGLTARMPGAESVIVPVAADVVLVPRGTTREGIQVRMVVEAEVELVVPAPDAPYADPLGSAALAAERVIGEVAGRADLPDLPGLLGDAWEELTVDVDRETSRHGVRVRSMNLVELDAVLAEAVTGAGGSG